MRVYHFNDQEGFKSKLNATIGIIYDIGTDSGLRVSDILDLPRILLFFDQFVIIERKTKKLKYIKIEPKTLEKIRSFLELNKGEFYAFPSVSSKSGRLTRQYVWREFKKAAKAAGIKVNVGTHSMRKNRAIEVYQNKRSMKAVKEALNHDNYSSIIYYLMDGEADGKPNEN